MTTHKTRVIHAADGSYTIDVGGVVFGPYGPGRCEAVHQSGNQCVHTRGHVGCHSANDPNGTGVWGKFKYRWH